ncbi:Heparin sulfate O-sulfotransferase [Polyplax serrata]|uniref:Heparin sulfate O-sulfotransferase n=1 Tax=Polyplax serrata TaxID=468196 RepID=A0ABR1AH50_POLSC
MAAMVRCALVVKLNDKTAPDVIPYKVPPLSRSEDIVVIYNRVPKTGSTSFVNIAYELCKKNHFKVLHINVTGNFHLLSMKNQIKFVHNITEWDAMKPALYHGHMAFIDFKKFRVEKTPFYINIIRKPLDRLVSYYYFVRYGDNYRPNLVRRKHGDKLSFDDCVAKNLPDCSYDNMWLQIPFFCGHAAQCWETGSPWALEEAKRNLVRNYFAVGVTEEMEEFIKLMEMILPRMFKGATQHYLNGNRSHLRETTQKVMPSEATVRKIQSSKVWEMEQEFYDFAYQQFKFNLRRLNLKKGSSNPTEKEQIFFYEKIRPK